LTEPHPRGNTAMGWTIKTFNSKCKFRFFSLITKHFF